MEKELWPMTEEEWGTNEEAGRNPEGAECRFQGESPQLVRTASKTKIRMKMSAQPEGKDHHTCHQQEKERCEAEHRNGEKERGSWFHDRVSSPVNDWVASL
jgi:hypothetical protein